MTKEDNKTIPLTDKYNWRQQPAVMLKWRAVAACARVIFPDVIMGFYTPEEIEPDVRVDDDGAIMGEVKELPAESGEQANGNGHEPRQDAPGTTECNGGLQLQPDTMKRPYSAPTLRAVLQDSINRRIARNADEALEIDDHLARALAIEWSGVMAGQTPSIENELARKAIVGYILGQKITTFKGLAIATHDALHNWLKDAKNARAEAMNVYQELAAMAEVEPGREAAADK